MSKEDSREAGVPDAVPDGSAPGPGGSAKKTRSRGGLIIRTMVSLALFLGALFGAAGRLDWVRGWIYVGVQMTGMTIIGIISHRLNAGLIQARAHWRHADTKRFDKIIVAMYLPLNYIQPAVAGLDAVRYGWSAMPFGFVYPGIALLALGTAIVGWVLSTNRFAETTVRIQTERGHTVVSSGPYRIVRHPMYVGAFLIHLALPFVLGSVWALTVTVILTLLLVVRTRLEDQTLRRELPGYVEYAEHTRYRLIPGLW